MKVWIAGNLTADRQMNIIGIFDSQEKAVAACDIKLSFVASFEFNKPYPHSQKYFDDFGWITLWDKEVNET